MGHSTMNIIASTCLFLGLAFLLVGLEATPQGKGRGIGRAPSAIVNCGCQCSNIMYRDEDGKVHGNCRSADDSGAQWCYVGAGSTCQDTQTSDKGPHGDDWSYEACATPSVLLLKPLQQVGKKYFHIVLQEDSLVTLMMLKRRTSMIRKLICFQFCMILNL